MRFRVIVVLLKVVFHVALIRGAAQESRSVCSGSRQSQETRSENTRRWESHARSWAGAPGTLEAMANKTIRMESGSAVADCALQVMRPPSHSAATAAA